MRRRSHSAPKRHWVASESPKRLRRLRSFSPPTSRVLPRRPNSSSTADCLKFENRRGLRDEYRILIGGHNDCRRRVGGARLFQYGMLMNPLATMEAFVRVVDTRSFSGAARQLRVGQPAISKAIMHVGDGLGVRLLLRSTRGLTATAAGRTFSHHAKLS